jgi:Tfp pilus assembly protein PilF
MKKIILLVLIFISNGILAQLKQVDYDNAIKLLLSNDAVKGLSNIEMLEKKFPNDAKVIALRGMYQYRDGDSNGAMMNLSKAIKIDPKFVPSFVYRAQMFVKKGMLDKAILDISEAIKLEPKNPEFYSMRSSYYYDNKQYVEGLNDCKTLIQLNPTNINGYYDAANFSKKIDPNANADVFFTQAYTAKGMQKFTVDFYFAKFLMSNKRFEESKPLMESALAAAEKDFDGDDLNIAGIIFYKNRDLDKAEALLLKSIAMNPNIVSVFNNLVSVYVDQEKWQKVAETASLALKADEYDPLANMFMAIGMSKNNQKNSGLRKFIFDISCFLVLVQQCSKHVPKFGWHRYRLLREAGVFVANHCFL